MTTTTVRRNDTETRYETTVDGDSPGSPGEPVRLQRPVSSKHS
jgi:hypothetical protein